MSNLITRRSKNISDSRFNTGNVPVAHNTGVINQVSKQPANPKKKPDQQKYDWRGDPRIQCRGGITTISLSTVSEVVLPFNPRRNSLFIQNLGVQTVYLSFDGPTSAADNYAGSIKIPPYGFIELKNPAPTNEIYGVSFADVNLITVVEGTIL